MSKFKIGDKVEIIDTNGDNAARGRIGHTGVVRHIQGDSLTEVEMDVDKKLISMFARRFELVAPAITPGKFYRTASGAVTGRVTKGDTGFEAVVDGKVRIFDAAGGAVHGGDDIVEEWAPKVGERVIVVETDNFHPAVSSETECVVDTVRGDSIWINASTKSNGVLNQIAYLSDLEPLPVAAQPAAPTLKIEAGRYYRTRDGRKVGPMEKDDWGDGRPWTDGARWYGGDGAWCDGEETENDLVAEWVDEPTAPVSAQVDAIAEEYGPAPANDNGKPKFKVGDRVVALEDSWTSVRKGTIYTVVEVLDEDIRFRKADGTIDGWGHKFFALFSPAPVTAIVALIEDGQPKPATRPHVHASEAEANTEAKRLAGIHKGKQFGVFVLTTTAEEAKPTYRHEWQRLAADGQKIAAIKELRSLTGMMLKPAKDVVEHFIDGPYNLAA